MVTRLAALAAAAALLLTGCGDSGKDDSKAAPAEPEPTTFDVSGSFELIGEGYAGGEPCSGSGGYSDIQQGVGVTIYDASQKAIALGDLGPGLSRNWDCKFQFTVSDVPIQEGSNIYSIEVSHRGTIQFTQDQAEDLALTLGD